MQVQGIVTKMSIVNPKLATSVQYCEATQKGRVTQHNDLYNLAEQSRDAQTGEKQGNTVRSKDDEGNALSTEFGYCIFKDFQVITIQELPENAPAGQLPRSTQVVLENDLVDACKPGDRVQVSGVFRVHHGSQTGDFRSVLVATGVKSLLAEKEKPILSAHDIKQIRKLA